MQAHILVVTRKVKLNQFLREPAVKNDTKTPHKAEGAELKRKTHYRN